MAQMNFLESYFLKIIRRKALLSLQLWMVSSRVSSWRVSVVQSPSQLYGICQEETLKLLQPTEAWAGCVRLCRRGGRWLAVFLRGSPPQPSPAAPRVGMLQVDLTELLLMFLPRTYILPEHSRALSGPRALPGAALSWVTLHCITAFSRCRNLLFHVEGRWGGLLGKLPSFYCSKGSAVKHLNFHLSELCWEGRPFTLQLVRVAGQSWNGSQGGCDGGGPSWMPILSSLETEVLGIL